MTQNATKNGKLTARMKKAIPVLANSRTISEGIRKAGINRATYYRWMQNAAFAAELERQRNELADNAFFLIKHNLMKAAEKLTALLNSRNEQLRRLTAKDILDYYLKHKEVRDLEERLEAIEQRLDEQK